MQSTPGLLVRRDMRSSVNLSNGLTLDRGKQEEYPRERQRRELLVWFPAAGTLLDTPLVVVLV